MTDTIRFPIGARLALIIGSILLSALVSVTFLNSYFVSQDVRITAEDNNLTINSRAAATVQRELEGVQESAMQFLDVAVALERIGAHQLLKVLTSRFFLRNKTIAELAVLSFDGKVRMEKDFPSSRYFSQENVADSMESPARLHFSRLTTETFLSGQSRLVTRAIEGEFLTCNASPSFRQPILALFLPYRGRGSGECCLILISSDGLSDILGTGGTCTTGLINGAGELLCYAESQQLLAGARLENNPLMARILNDSSEVESSQQITFSVTEEDGRKVSYLGAYRKLPLFDCTVFTTIPLDLVLESVRATRRNNLYLASAVLFIAVMLILTFSRYGISRHLRLLSACAQEIQQGNFNSQLISRLKLNRRDEIGVLNRSSRDEQEFLNTFARFTNREVAKAIARKEIDFEPHLKDVTIFFSDIRGFTAISDGFKERFGEESPREIIGFLNDYMSRMVKCVTISGGNIDKFEGDAIMAVWGILRNESLAFEKLPDGDEKKAALARAHRRMVQEDAMNAIRGTAAMRYALMAYNKAAAAFNEREKAVGGCHYKPHIKIGCGINTGRATCGIMGSEDKMEYTAIGDSVNFASRTESSNKLCGTDILLSEDTWNLLKDDYAGQLLVERIPVAFEVKGKGLQHFYALVNLPAFDIEAFFRAEDPDFVLDADCERAVGPLGPKSLAELRQLLDIPSPDYEKINLHEESKVQIKQ